MTIQLQEDAQTLVDLLFYEKDRIKQNDAVRIIAARTDKDQIEEYVLDRLSSGMNRWQITWSLSALSMIDLPDGKKEVLRRVYEQNEPDGWIRHFAILNAANFSPFPQKQIQDALQDHDFLPRATAFRILLANGQDLCADELQSMLDDESNPEARWAAARALRNRTDPPMKPLREHIENQFIQPLVDIVSNMNVYLDTRWDALQALASFQHRKGLVAGKLGEVLIEDESSTVRRFCLEVLVKLNQPEESKNALLKATEDTDAQIRLDAANTLKTMLGAENSIRLLLPFALERDKNTAWIVDALRHIDSGLAAKEIREALSSPDNKISTRASQLLTELGGQAAAQILMNERTEALKNYTNILSDADQDVRKHFKELMSQAKIAFWLSLMMHTIVFGLGIWVLITSLDAALDTSLSTFSKWIGVGGAGTGALAILLSAFYSSPLKNVRSSLNSLMQVDVVFLGYVRQINQIDATFKHMFIGSRDFGSTQMKATVLEIQSSVKVSLEEIKQHIQEK